MIVMGPAERIPELRPILLDWRRDAKLLLESDLPSADQSPGRSTVCAGHFGPSCRSTLSRALATAEAWLLAQHPRLDARRVHAPQPRSQP